MWEFPASQQLHTFATPAVHLPQSSLQGTVKNLTTTISQIHFAWRVMTSLWRTATADRHGLAVSDAAPCVTSSDVKVPRRAHKQHLSRRVACTVNKLMQIQASPFARKQEQLAAHWGRREGLGGGVWLGGVQVLNWCWVGAVVWPSMWPCCWRQSGRRGDRDGRPQTDTQTRDTSFPQCNASKAHLGSLLFHSFQQYHFNWHFLFPQSYKWKPPFNCFHMANPN